MSGISINLLPYNPTKDERTTIVNVLTSAFADDRLMLELLGKDRWMQVSHRYFTIELRRSDVIITAIENNAITGVLLASSPRKSHSGLKELINSFQMVCLLRDDNRRSQQVARELAQILPTVPHWYVNHLAVLPDRQNHDIGSTLMEQVKVLAVDDEEIYLDCANETSSFYRQADFNTVQEIQDLHMQMMRFSA